MSNDSSKKKPGFQFNIIKDDPLTGHKGQNFGAISVENVAPVYIDIDTQETFIDIGGLHGRADVERRVKWVNDIEEPKGEGQREFWLVWVTVERTKGGDRKSTRLNSSHVAISYAVFCLKKEII